MSTEKIHDGATTPNATGADPAVPMLAPEEVVAQLRAIRGRIPEYKQLTSTDALALRSAAGVSRDFVMTSIHATGLSQVVQDFVGAPPDALLADTADDDRWTAVEDELRAMLKGVSSGNLARRHRIGTAALLAYGITRQLIRRPEYADLIPHVQELKRLRRLGRRKPADTPPPAPETKPATS